MGTGFLAFAGALAVAFITFFAGPRAVQMSKDELYLASYLWWLIGLAFVAIVCFGWVRMGDQPMWVIKPALFLVGALIGGVAFLAAGELIYPTARAQSPHPPTEEQQPAMPSNSSTPPAGASGNFNFSMGFSQARVAEPSSHP